MLKLYATENVRSLNELRESLQQQTATADVLRLRSTKIVKQAHSRAVRHPGENLASAIGLVTANPVLRASAIISSFERKTSPTR